MPEQKMETQPVDGAIYILLAEDNEADAKIAKRAFQECKVKNNLYIVNDGQEALDFVYHQGKYQDKDKYPRPEFILLDINMPRVNGFEVLRRLKNYPKLRMIPVAMLTSSRNEGDVNESYAIGACSYIPKPVHYEEFKEVVNSLSVYWGVFNRLPKPGEETVLKENSSPVVSESAGKKKILIIDDDLQHLRLMSIVLNKNGMTNIVLADTGEKGLEVLEKEVPDIVILDTILPKKNGFEVCAEIKRLRGDLTKVILNTGVIDSVNSKKAKEAGADEYLAKTLDSNNIIQAVQKLMRPSP